MPDLRASPRKEREEWRNIKRAKLLGSIDQLDMEGENERRD